MVLKLLGAVRRNPVKDLWMVCVSIGAGGDVKEAYYFSHDANARHDPKIMKMFFVMKSEGYGIFWVIIEMLRNEPGHKLCTSDCNAIAYQAHTDVDKVKEIVYDYDLFTISEDGKYFWSESLLRRMQEFKRRSEQARNSANARWGNANAMPTQCENDAVKESKVNEIKENTYVQEFFDYFVLKTKKKLKMNPARRSIIESRLKTHSIDQLKLAVDNFIQDKWTERYRFMDIVYCIGIRGKIDNLERWINMAEPKKKERGDV